MKRKTLKQERIKRIICYLHWHGQSNLAQIARHLGIPKSTVFDYMKEIEKQYSFVMVRRH